MIAYLKQALTAAVREGDVDLADDIRAALKNERARARKKNSSTTKVREQRP